MASSPTYFDPKWLAKVNGLRVRAKHVVDGYLAGAHRSPFRGYSVEFSEHRDYVPGDDPRYLDWKILGRTDKLYVKQFEDETNLVSYSILDASESMSYPRHLSGELTKLEYASIMATAISWLVLQQQDTASLAVVNDRIQAMVPPTSERGQIKNMIETLENVSGNGKTKLSTLLLELEKINAKRGIYFVFSDFFEDAEQLGKSLQYLRQRKQGITCVQVLADSEIDFTFERPSRFLGLEGKPTVQVDPLRLRESYLGEMRRFLDRTAAICRNLGVHHHLIRTSMPLDLAIAEVVQPWS